jgi:hypothetical protein
MKKIPQILKHQSIIPIIQRIHHSVRHATFRRTSSFSGLF